MPYKSDRYANKSAGTQTWKMINLKSPDRRTKERFWFSPHENREKWSSVFTLLKASDHQHGGESICLQNRRKTWICTVFFFILFFSFLLLTVTQMWITASCLSLQHKSKALTEEFYLKAIGKRCHKKTWLISRVLWSILIVCVLKAIGRSQDSCLCSKQRRESLFQEEVRCGNICLKGYT